MEISPVVFRGIRNDLILYDCCFPREINAISYVSSYLHIVSSFAVDGYVLCFSTAVAIPREI